jgi:hypothetical protein
MGMKGALALFALIAASIFGDWFYNLWHGPLHLACHGQYVTEFQSDQLKEAKTLHVEVDFKKSTVTVESFVGDFKITSNGPDGMKFADESLGEGYLSDGRINRYTGSIAVFARTPDGGFTFDGLCRPAERLF